MYGYQNYPYQQSYGTTPSYLQRMYTPQPPQNAPQQPQTPQGVQIPTQAPLTQQTPQIQDVRYGTEEEAKAFIVLPNCIAYFIDLSKNRLYTKFANPSGISSMEYFSLTPINADGSPVKPQEVVPQVNFDDFVKKEQIKDMGFVSFEQFKALADKLEQMQKRLDGARANVPTPKINEKM